MQRMPYPAHLEERFNNYEVMKAMYPVVAILAFLIPLCIETTYPTNEKSLGLNVYYFLNYFYPIFPDSFLYLMKVQL